MVNKWLDKIASYYVNVTDELANDNSQVTIQDVDYWRSEMNKWGSLIQESVSFLMNGFLGKGVVAGSRHS